MPKLPDHLFAPSADGALFDTRVPEWSRKPPLRPVYERTFPEIENAAQLKATLRAGGYAWPGGYPMFLIMADGEAMSFKAARERSNLRELLGAFADPTCGNGWRVVGCDVNWEDSDLYCCQSNEKIESAYGADESEEESGQ